MFVTLMQGVFHQCFACDLKSTEQVLRIIQCSHFTLKKKIRVIYEPTDIPLNRG